MCTYLKYWELTSQENKTIYMICSDKKAESLSLDEKLKVVVISQGSREEMRKLASQLVYQPKFR